MGEDSILPVPCSPLCTHFLGDAPIVSYQFLTPSFIPLWSNSLLSFLLFFIYLLSFCLRHFSLMSVFTSMSLCSLALVVPRCCTAHELMREGPVLG